MEILTLFLRTVLIYFVVLGIMRIMGKREIGKLSVFDLVISIMIAEIAVFVLEDTKKPLLAGLLPIGTLVAIQLLISYVSLKSRKLREWFDGSPSIIINKGKLNKSEMKRQRYNLDDLMLQLRQNRITNVADVEFAILEPSGKLTVVEKREQGGERDRKPAADGIRLEGLPLPLVMDGKVQDDNLEKIGKTRFWLKNEIRRKGAADFRDVFFCTIDHRGVLYVDKAKR